MAQMSYLDFDLLLQREGDGFRARVASSPAGQASFAFSLPFSSLEIENFLLRVGRPRHGTRRIDSPEEAAVYGFGTRLFEAAFGGEVRGCFRSSIDEALRQEKGLRVRLHLSDTPELADLPWEYLCNPGLRRFLSLSYQTPVVRYLDLPETIRPLAVAPPIRILVMIAGPSDYPRLDAGEEWERLNEALGDLRRARLVEVQRLHGANLSVLQQQLRRAEYNVFHYVGHGGFDQQSQAGVLILEDRGGRGQAVSGQSLGMLLHNHRALRLGSVALVRLSDGKRALDSEAHLWSVVGVAFGRGGLLASWSSDKTVLWQATDADPLPALVRLQKLPGTACAAFSPDGALLALEAEGEVRLFATGDGRLVRGLESKEIGGLQCLEFSADGGLVAGGGRQVHLWSAVDGRRVASLGDYCDAAKHVSFSRDGTMLLAVAGGALWRWRLR